MKQIKVSSAIVCLIDFDVVRELVPLSLAIGRTTIPPADIATIPK